MGRAEQAIELPATPSRHEIQANLEHLRDTLERRQADGLEPPMLDAPDDGCRGFRSRGDIDLPESKPDPDRSEDAPDPNVVHPSSVETPASPLLIGTPVRYDACSRTHRWTTATQTVDNSERRVHERPAAVDEHLPSVGCAWMEKARCPQHVGIGRGYKPQDVVVLP
jgi:hypothetical protein